MDRWQRKGLGTSMIPKTVRGNADQQLSKKNRREPYILMEGELTNAIVSRCPNRSPGSGRAAHPGHCPGKHKYAASL